MEAPRDSLSRRLSKGIRDFDAQNAMNPDTPAN